MTAFTDLNDALNAFKEALAYALSTKRVRECADSLRNPAHDWKLKPNGEAHRTRPYPMGFYPGDPNLYYAIGWGLHEYMWPWERALLLRLARERCADALARRYGR